MRTCSQKSTGEHSGPTEVRLHTGAVCLGHLAERSPLPASTGHRTIVTDDFGGTSKGSINKKKGVHHSLAFDLY
jgi:hypothetical protein